MFFKKESTPITLNDNEIGGKLIGLLKEQHATILALQKHIIIIENSINDLKNFIDITLDDSVNVRIDAARYPSEDQLGEKIKEEIKDSFLKYAIKIDAPQNEVLKELSDKINLLDAKIADQTIHIKSIETFIQKGSK